MEYISKFVSNFKEYYNGINAATLTGAIDVVIVQQEDGSFLSSPFHVRFGKLGVLRSREKIVDIEINGDPVDIHMKLGESGEAFFVTESGSGDEDIPAHLATSPIPPFEMDPPSPDGTLMGQRDEGILSSLPGTGDIVIGPIPEGVTVFKAETVVAGQVEGSFKPIQPAQEEVAVPEEATTLTEDQQQQLPGEEVAASPDEERRKPYRRRRKRRSLNKKKTSKNNDDDDAEDVETTTTEESVPNTPRKDTVLDMEVIRGHRKSHSVTVIDFGPPDSSSTAVNDDWFNGPMSRSLGPGFHFFSDTEADMEGRETSRPPSPVHSDTEYEVGLQRKTDSEDAANTTRQSWRWGELPSPPVNLSPAVKAPSRNISRDHSPSAGFAQQSESQDQGDERENAERKNQAERNAETAQQEEAKRSMLSHMFSFMRQTKKIRNQAAASGEGIYLDDLDLNDLDPELAALYFPPSSLKPAQAGSSASIPTHRDDDAESGRGPSLPQSPHSMAAGPTGSKSGPRSIDSDFEDSRGGFHELRTFPDVAMSLCGNLNDMPELPDELFLQSLVSYDDFLENPRLLESPDLVVRIGSKYYNWQTACPIIMSWALYQRPLPQNAVDVLAQEYMSKRNPQQQDKKKTDPQTQQQQQQQQQRSGYSWFSWGKKETKKPQDPPQEAAVSTSTSTVSSSPTVAVSTVTSSTTSTTVSMEAPAVVAAPPVAEPVTTQVAVDLSASPTLQQPLLETKLELLASTTSSDSESITLTDSLKKLPMERRSYYENTDKYLKTLRLSSEDVIKLNLRDGPNEAVFSVTTAYQGTTRCKCHIYLWKYDDKIVISDIDGTITKSDVLGHILPIVGKDWAQSGVAQLFTKIKNNGYRILYLSARAIGQARITRDYLRSVRQGDLCLPDGPLLLNPTSLLSAFHREVIEKKPEEFKISCLRDIQALFPSHTNPFYAGYGNKVNDVWAYRAVGIPISRIFTINHRGELKHELTQTFQSSYSKQSFIVDLVFPPLHGSSHVALENADFNEFSYWREPFQDLPTDINRFTTVYEIAGSRSRRSSKIEPKIN